MQGKSEPLADVARRTFAEDQLAIVFAALDRYTGPERERVQRAILTLRGDDVGKLSHNVAGSRSGLSRLLYWAEYPPSAWIVASKSWRRRSARRSSLGDRVCLAQI